MNNKSIKTHRSEQVCNNNQSITNESIFQPTVCNYIFNWILRPRWRKERVSKAFSPVIYLYSLGYFLRFPLFPFLLLPLVARPLFLHVPLSSFYPPPSLSHTLTHTRSALQTQRLIIEMLSSLLKCELGRRLRASAAT